MSQLIYGRMVLDSPTGVRRPHLKLTKQSDQILILSFGVAETNVINDSHLRLITTLRH